MDVKECLLTQNSCSAEKCDQRWRRGFQNFQEQRYCKIKVFKCFVVNSNWKNDFFFNSTCCVRLLCPWCQWPKQPNWE